MFPAIRRRTSFFGPSTVLLACRNSLARARRLILFFGNVFKSDILKLLSSGIENAPDPSREL